MKLKLLLLKINAYYEANDITESKNSARFNALDLPDNQLHAADPFNFYNFLFILEKALALHESCSEG